MTAPTLRLAFALCGLGVAFPASAADIRSQLTPDLIYNHCQTAGVGSEKEGTFMLPGGRVTGTVLCTEADLAAGRAMAATAGRGDDDDDDDDRGRDHDNDDNDDHGGDDRDD